VALLADGLERVDEEPGRLGEEMAVRHAASLAARRLAIVAVDEDHVDVRRIIQLVAAELAHADHRQPGWCPVGHDRAAVDRAERILRPAPRGGDTHVGEA